jgi:hypothetical protein
MGAAFAELECPKSPPLHKPQGWATRRDLVLDSLPHTAATTRRQIQAAKTRLQTRRQDSLAPRFVWLAVLCCVCDRCGDGWRRVRVRIGLKLAMAADAVG